MQLQFIRRQAKGTGAALDGRDLKDRLVPVILLGALQNLFPNPGEFYGSVDFATRPYQSSICLVNSDTRFKRLPAGPLRVTTTRGNESSNPERLNGSREGAEGLIT